MSIRIATFLLFVLPACVAQTTQISLGLTSYPIGNSPTPVALGDINGDGRLDIVANSFNDNSVSVLLNNGDGTFGAPIPSSWGAFAEGLAIADFNADGNLDVAANTFGDTVTVLLGNGDGTFQHSKMSAQKLTPYTLTAADFNGDGKIDLAVGSTGEISILLGKGDGTFGAATVVNSGSGTNYTIVAGDFNGDGRLDIAASVDSDSAVSVLLGHGDGTFQNSVEYPTVILPVGLVSADFNGDGKLDLAAQSDGTGPNGAAVSILIGNGDGSFQAHVDYRTVPYDNVLAKGDFNGDGIIDLVTASNSKNLVMILLGNGDGSFASSTFAAVNSSPFALAAGDVDGDGLTDVIAAAQSEGTVGVLRHGHSVLSKTLVNFGTVAIGDTKSTPITITNTGNTAFTVVKTQLLGLDSENFFHTFACDGVTIDPGSSCTFKVGVAPTMFTQLPGTIAITDDGAPGLQSVTLYGQVSVSK